MSTDDRPLTELLMARLDLCHQISATNAKRLAHQLESLGAEITLLNQQRAGADGGTAAQEEEWSEAGRQQAAALSQVEALDEELAALEAAVEAIDVEIAERQRGQ